jgi:hypothetical protein
MNDTRMLQLTTGQTVIGKAIDDTALTITLEQPLGIRMVDQGNNQVGIGFVPYDPINPEGRVMFNKSQVVSEPLDIPHNMIKGYAEQTSRIQIVSALDQMEGMR